MCKPGNFPEILRYFCVRPTDVSGSRTGSPLSDEHLEDVIAEWIRTPEDSEVHRGTSKSNSGRLRRTILPLFV